MAVCLMMTKQKNNIMLFSFTLVQAWNKHSYSLFIEELGGGNILQFCINYLSDLLEVKNSS